MNLVENFLLNHLDLRLENRYFARELILKNDFDSEKLIAIINSTNGKQKVHLLCFCDTFSRTHLLYFKNDFQYFIDLAENENHETNKRSLTNIYIGMLDRKSTRLNSSHVKISYAV